MINPKKFYKTIKNIGIKQYVGVPDSVLKHLLSIIPKKKILYLITKEVLLPMG